MAVVENPVLGKHYAANLINIFKSGIVNGPEMQGKIVCVSTRKNILSELKGA